MIYLRAFNYSGSKFRFLDKLLEHFPKEIDTFIEPFVGSGSVFLNVNAKRYIINDYRKDIYYFWKACFEDIDRLSLMIDNLNNKDFSIKENYFLFRDEYNKVLKSKDYFEIASRFYVLTNICINNQARWNKDGEFNQGCGERNFRNNLEIIRDKIKSIEKIYIYNFDFSKIPVIKKAFYYFDPPYLIQTSSFDWNIEDEKRLLKYIENVDKFILSNQFENNSQSANKNNILLEEFCKKYSIININSSYNSGMFKKRNNKLKTREVLIKNF